MKHIVLSQYFSKNWEQIFESPKKPKKVHKFVKQTYNSKFLNFVFSFLLAVFFAALVSPVLENTNLLESLMGEFKVVGYEKDELEYRDMSILVALSPLLAY